MNHQLSVVETDHTPALTHSVALAMFDGARRAHGLPKHMRNVLEQAELFYAAARRTGDERPDRLGRDLALAAPIDGLDADEQAMLGCAVALQRDKTRARREPCFLRLDKKKRRRAQQLAAILQVATALQVPSTSQLLVQTDGEGTLVIVGGAAAPAIVTAVEAGAELWRKRIGPLRVRVEAPEDTARGLSMLVFEGSTNGTGDSVLTDRPVGGEPMAELARRTLRRFFERLLSREDDVLGGEDAEDVHQMRVATRRLRASLQVVEGVYDPKLIRRFRRGLQQIAGSLGAVRDGDVFLQHVAAYREAQPAAEQAALTP